MAIGAAVLARSFQAIRQRLGPEHRGARRRPGASARPAPVVIVMLTLVAVASGASSAQTAPAPGAPNETSAKGAEKKPGRPLDINTATMGELRALPGISEADARRITENRPYARKEELARNRIISYLAYEKIRNLIVVTPPQPEPRRGRDATPIKGP